MPTFIKAKLRLGQELVLNKSEISHNLCIGQTSSGKSYTLACDVEPGVVELLIGDLYNGEGSAHISMTY